MTQITSTPGRTPYSFEDDGTAVELTIAGDDTGALCHRGPRDEGKGGGQDKFLHEFSPLWSVFHDNFAAVDRTVAGSDAGALCHRGPRDEGKGGGDEKFFHMRISCEAIVDR